jgi:hydrogenase maturation protease
VSEDPTRNGSGDFLVIGYGNTLRSDDGVGAKVAAAVAELALPGVTALVRHQLTPELAETISEARMVVFVDAAVDAATEVQMRRLEPAEGAQLMAHAADPRTLLTLAKQLFGRCPPAWWLTIPVENLEFGEELSPLARRGHETALAKIRMLVAPVPCTTNPNPRQL